MPSITPTVTVQATPAISVTTVNAPPYEDFRRSLGDYVYRTYMLYLATANFNQLSSTYTFIKYDSAGNKILVSLIPFVSPYQKQKTLFFDVSDKPLFIDGRNALKFIMLANTALKFKMFSIQDSVGQFVKEDGKPVLGPDNFQSFESATGMYNFFDHFKDDK